MIRSIINYIKSKKRIIAAKINKSSELDLSNLNLRTIPKSVFSMTHIHDLELSDNNIKEISTSISN